MAAQFVSGAKTGVTRSLGHLKPPKKGTQHNVPPAKVAHTPKFVQPEDRIAFWNIVPGDEVRLRTGRVGENLGYDAREKIRGEGKVVSIDKQRNLAWLTDIDENNPRAPKNLKHMIPRVLDPEDLEKGYTPNTMEIPRPVHYSNLMLRIPPIKGESQTDSRFAVRIERKNTHYNKHLQRWVWQRFAVVRNDDGTTSRIHVPWPEGPHQTNQPRPDTASKEEVAEETWLPWSPMDPVHMTPERPWSSEQSEEDTMLLRAQRARVAEEQAKAAKAARGDEPQRRLGSYAGFASKKKPKKPPVPQPPTASELLSYSSQSLSAWASDPLVRQHVAEGGRSFAPSDYLDFAPTVGPAAGGDWQLPLDEQGFKLAAFRRDSKTGKLISTSTDDNGASGSSERVLSRAHFDSMPVELLMGSELSNPHGLKQRRRRHAEMQVLTAMEAQEAAEADEAAVKDLRRYVKDQIFLKEFTAAQQAVRDRDNAASEVTVAAKAAAARAAESETASDAADVVEVSGEIATEAAGDVTAEPTGTTGGSQSH